jgi:predicted RNA-binding Zn ribbon-like protein
MGSDEPRRETRETIERARAEAKRAREAKREEFLRRTFNGLSLAEIEAQARRNSRRRPPSMAPALVEPPRGPLPMQGGAAAPLEFGAD